MSATLDASRMRLRPILMTSLAFIFGVLPMTTSSAPVPAASMRSAPGSWAA